MLKYTIMPVRGLSPDYKNIMYSLLEQHFNHCSYQRFINDLEEKEGVIMLFDKEEKLQGYSTYLYYPVTFQKEEINILFSGDTIIDKQYWGDSALFKGFFAVLLEKMQSCGGRRFYWFLISKGIRTYLILPLFYKVFYPNYKEATPSAIQEFMHFLAENKFGNGYCREIGVIKSQGDYLNKELAEIPEHKYSNPHVNFFLKQNRNWQTGDELVCLTEISYDNFKPIVKRLMESAVTR